MQRREFLKSASAVAGASALPFATRSFAISNPTRWHVLWAASSEPGTEWQPLQQACVPDCEVATLYVTMDAFHSADGSNSVSQLAVHAVYDLRGGESARFLAWQFGGIGIHRSATAGPTRFIAGRAALRRFEIEYRHADEACAEHCDLTGSGSLLLSPGHYLLAGPRPDGSKPTAHGRGHSSDVTRPLAGPVDFDYLAFRVEAAA